MAQVLKNVLVFTGLVVGVPSVQPHGLILNGLGAVIPKVLSPTGGGFAISADNTNVTVVRLPTGATSVNVLCEYWHSYEDSQPQPNGIATSVFPVVVAGGGVGGGGAIQSLAAGTTLATGPLISFVDGGNITFGINGNTITASVQTAGGTATGVGIIAGTTSAATGAVSFANSNNISFGMNASTVTASFSASIQPNPAISAAGASASNGTIVWSNSNNVSFGMAGSTITASVTVSASSLSFSNLNGVSFGTAGSTLTASVAAGATATGNFGGLTAAGGAITSGTASFLNGSGVSFGINGQTVTASIAAGATATGNLGGLAAAGGTITSGTVSFANSNGVSFGVNGQTVTASFSGGGAETPFGISAGTQSVSTGTMIFTQFASLGNNVTFGMSGSRTITAQAGINVGATNGTGGQFDGVDFIASNGVAFGVNGRSVTARVATVSGTNTELVQVLASGAAINISNANNDISIVAGTARTIEISANVARIDASNIILLASAGINLAASGAMDIGASAIALGAIGFGIPVLSVQVQQNSTGNLGFFNANGTNRRTVTGASTNATLLINQVLQILGSLGLFSNNATT